MQQLRCQSGTHRAPLWCVPQSVSYILPIRSSSFATDELVAYLCSIAGFQHVTEVIVVDGSDPAFFADFDRRCGHAVRHVKVDPDLQRLANGKVAGVLTGLRLASRGPRGHCR